jgi:hypothetical protein
VCAEYYNDSSLACHPLVVTALQQLAADRDTDVREAAARGHRVQAAPPPQPATGEQEHKEKEGDEEKEGEEGESGVGSDPPSWAQIAAK